MPMRRRKNAEEIWWNDQIEIEKGCDKISLSRPKRHAVDKVDVKWRYFSMLYVQMSALSAVWPSHYEGIFPAALALSCSSFA